MENVSHQSKQKQPISKKGSQAKKTNGKTVEGTTNVYLSVEQADLFKVLLAATNEAQSNLNFALLAANINGENIVGGHLDGDKPHFTVRNINAQKKS